MTEPPVDRRRWQRVKAVLDRALELSRDELPAFLEQACAGDPELEAEVKALLEADRQTGGMLESPAAEYAATLLDKIREAPEGLARPGPARPGLTGRSLGPYQVIRRVGGGGMGIVYEAFDTRLQREVALKLLPREWSRDPAARERLVREARAASALDHPNICAVHDVGETEGGRMFIVMAYYEGETLERKLEQGSLTVEQALDFALQVARGLERAHEVGITHRDVKPANVMVTRHGEAKILDFGIAKIAGDAGLTHTGVSPGTPAYMSPEQASGDAVDHRTDVWALGVMLYEMIAGRRPFRADNAAGMIHAILHRQPEPLARWREGVPEALERTLERALAKDPGQRCPTMTHLRTDLESAAGVTASRQVEAAGGLTPAGVSGTGRWPRRYSLAALAALAILALATGYWPNRPGSTGRCPGAPAAGVPAAGIPAGATVVGIVPFANRTGDAELDWYGEGIARLVADGLSSSRHLQVVAAQRTEALAAIGSPAERARRAAEDGIDVLLTGEILPGGPEGLTLASRLIETAGGRRRAACRRDRLAPPELLQAAAEIVREARKGLALPTTEAVDFFAADFAAKNPEAYDAFVAGLRAFARFHYPEAEGAFRQALAGAPGFTMARYRLAQVLSALSRTDEALAEIRRAASEADRLSHREALYVRAADAYIARRNDQAAAAYRQLIERYPYETEARMLLALALQSTGRYREALEALAELALLEPRNPRIWSLSGETHLSLGNLHQAVVDLSRYTELEPASANGHHLLGQAYQAQGELDLAIEKYSRALAIDPAFHPSAVALAIVDVLRGERHLARERLAALAADPGVNPRHRIHAAFELAALHRAQGRFRQAAAALAARSEIIAHEKVREAMALAVRGNSLMQVGEVDAARRLIDLAVARSPTVPTRYLFTRGLLELHQRRFEALEQTVIEILQGKRPPDEADRKAEKAAAYLRGQRWLAEGRPQQAIEDFSRAVALDGYQYAVYRLALARAYLAAGKLPKAMAAARQASRQRDPGEPRLDLELDRARALLVLAQVAEAMGRPAQAAAHAQELVERWRGADPGFPELAEARRLAGADS